MSENDKPKPVIRWRIKQGDLYGKISHNFDSRGVIVLTPNKDEASTWACEYHATLAVKRTFELQTSVKRSALADWPKFKPLWALAAPSYESFELTPAEAMELANR